MWQKADENLEWSIKGVKDLKEKIVQISTSVSDKDPLKILFLGDIATGKSSLISSIFSTFQGEPVFTSTVENYEFGHEFSVSRRYLEHRIYLDPKEGGALNFILCDTPGIGKSKKQGASDMEIERLISGQMRHGDLIETDEHPVIDKMKSRNPEPPCSVVFVQNAKRLGEIDENVQQKLFRACALVRERGISSSLVLTHIDLVKPGLESELHKALTSKKIKTIVQEVSMKMGVPESRVFVVKNYTNERYTHVENDILILRALHGILLDAQQHQKDKLCASVQDSQEYRSENVPRLQETWTPSSTPSVASGHHSSVSEPCISVTQGEFGASGIFYCRRPASWESGYFSDQGNKSENYRALRQREDGEYEYLKNHQRLLQKRFSTKAIYTYPQDFSEIEIPMGAKPLYRTCIRTLKENIRIMHKEEGFQLKKEKNNSNYYEFIQQCLETWAKPNTGIFWISDYLFSDLNLPIEQLQPCSLDVQILFMAPEKPVFLLSLYDTQRAEHEAKTGNLNPLLITENETREVQNFTCEMARLLTCSLFNFCYCDFIILPCTINNWNYDPECIEKEVSTQMEYSRQYYGGPHTLDENTYADLRRATEYVVGVSYVPMFLVEPNCHKDEIVLLDFEMQDAVSLMIECLGEEEHHHMTYEIEAKFKVQVTILEVAKRLSYATPVVIITEDLRIHSCAKRLAEQVEKDTGLKLQLQMHKPSDITSELHGTYGFVIDCQNLNAKYLKAVNAVLYIYCSRKTLIEIQV